MQFNSFLFIFLFTPVFVVCYFLLSGKSIPADKIIIVVFSALFYVFAGLGSVLVLCFSLAVNYLVSVFLTRSGRFRKTGLLLAIFINIGMLYFFKYYNFSVTAINDLFGTGIATRSLLVPLAISFFTFQQIMYVVSVYRREIQKAELLDYLCCILFFPKLLMGPLVEPKDFIEQLNDRNLKNKNWTNIACGIKIFCLGLFKKMVLADTFSRVVSWRFSNFDTATSGDWFLIVLFCSFEIYFDFSGYSDMATGVSKMINITLPINFDSPYKALSIRDFWKRWHISLTGFFRKYVYIPLGGNRKGTVRTAVNIIVVFLISGLWHGASWTFIMWGFIYAVLQLLERIFDKGLNRQHSALRWMYTFFSVGLLWVLFRAASVEQWGTILERMFSFENMSISDGMIQSFLQPETQFLLDKLDFFNLNSIVRGFPMLICSLGAFLICMIPENNYRRLDRISIPGMLICVAAFVWAVLCLSNESVFVYLNF